MMIGPTVVSAAARTAARSIWRRLPATWRRAMRPSAPQGEAPAGWYDEFYSNAGEAYACHYTASPYYFVWTVIAERARRAQGILEVGCGPGQLAHFLHDQGYSDYVGFDFSERAVAMARARVPGWTFYVDDARSSRLYQSCAYDTVICTEVLEHIEDDLDVLKCIPSGVRVIATVPNFDSRSHVRFFKDAEEARQRYAHLFREATATTLPKSEKNRFFLFEGMRK